MKTVAIDFDGVIHKYSKGWQNGEVYDDPVEGAFEAIMKLYKTGWTIAVFTAREDLTPVEKWFWKRYDEAFPNSEHIPVDITNKKPIATWYIDDRAIAFMNWGDTLDEIYNSGQFPVVEEEPVEALAAEGDAQAEAVYEEGLRVEEEEREEYERVEGPEGEE